MVMQKEIVNNRKMSIGFITDSACDLPSDFVDKYQIQVVPLKVHFGDQFFLDGLTLKPQQLYKKLDSPKVYPNSAQPSYHDFLNKYDYLSTHFDSIIGIHISKNMSGVWSNSNKAGTTIAQQQGKDISVLDSKRLASGQGLLVLRAAMAADEGMSKNEIVSQMDTWIKNTRSFVSVKTLKYLIRSGRVSPMKGAIGKFFNLKPLVIVNDDGRTEVIGKPFTEKGSIELAMKEIRKLVAEYDIWGYAISHANNPSTSDYYSQEMEKLTGMKPIYVTDAPPALALNTGLGVVALSVMIKSKKL